MSYGEELMTEMLIAEALEEQDRKDQVCRFYGAIGAKVWITSDGSSISIHKMDSRHIRNCISMLKRNMPLYDEPFDIPMFSPRRTPPTSPTRTRSPSGRWRSWAITSSTCLPRWRG